MLFGLTKSNSVVEDLISGLSIPMFYKFDGVNKYITNSAFDAFFGSARKKALDFINSYSLNVDDNFEIEVENDIGQKISAITYISSFNKKSGDRLGLLVDISEQKRAKEAIAVLKERYELATSGSNEGLWDWNIQKDNLYVSMKFKELLGDRADGLNSSLKSFISLVELEDKEGFIKNLEDHLNGYKSAFKYEFKININGKKRWFLVRGKAVSENKKIKRVVGFLSDISDIKFAQLALKDSQEQFESFMKNLPAGVYIRDLKHNIIFANRYINNFFGKESIVGNSIDKIFQNDEYKKILSLNEAILKDGVDSSETKMIDRFGNVKFFQLNQFVLHKDKEKYIGAIYTDITSQKMTEKKLDKLAHYDLLTNLPNRALFYDSLNHIVSKASRNNTKVALMFLDLDNFKTINDTLGHDYGDILLKEVASKLKSILRSEDIVSRLGGDEFTIILDGISDNAFPSVVAQKIIDTLGVPIKLKDELGYIGSSIGISIYPDDTKDQDELIKYADMAMYRAKESGKNTYRYFTNAMDKESREKMELTNDLREAVIKDQLKLYYQPIIDIKEGKVGLFEALVRWEHPKYGLISPENFISLAEEGGFMVKVGRWILNKGCQKIKELQDLGYDIKIAINVSSKQLTQNHLEETTKKIVKDSGINPRLLELEVTEGFLMENIKKVEEVLTNLRDFGIGISIDDFGTGYSSLSRLKSLPITKLKIDKSFIDDIVEEEDDREIVKVIISLAKSLNLEIVAEGVETKEQLKLINDLGCKLIQGYYFSKPLHEDRVVRYLKEVMK